MQGIITVCRSMQGYYSSMQEYAGYYNSMQGYYSSMQEYAGGMQEYAGYYNSIQGVSQQYDPANAHVGSC